MNYTSKTIQQFAPVIIPTLCRYEHFKSCLISLSQCTYANETEVFIGLDYPLKPEHWDGYNKIRQFLNEFNDKVFKRLIIIKRPYNYGLGPHGNSIQLIKDILQNYNAYIYSEDDNIFSPNFLEYINKGLQLYKDDKSIFAINGYKFFYNFRHEENNYFAENVGFSAWGYGIWKDRQNLFLKENTLRFYIKGLLNPFALYRIYQNGWSRINCLLRTIYKKDITAADYIYNLYMPIKKQNVIMPIISKVKNCGWDGSGENCHTEDISLRNMHTMQPIDTETHFEFIGNPYTYYKENRDIIKQNGYSSQSFRSFILSIIQSIIRKVRK